MITHRRADQRHHDSDRWPQCWFTFHSKEGGDALADSLEILKTLSEDILPPGASVLHQVHHDAETITYVRDGALAYDDSIGRSGIIHAGEFQRVTIGRGVGHSETNASQTDWAHVFQIQLCPSQAMSGFSQDLRWFSAAERRGVLRVVASPDGQRGSLRVYQDVLIYSAILDRGRHVVHELLQGLRAWLYLVKGEAVLGDVVLTSGDGAGVTAERGVSLTARENTEILLLDLREVPNSITGRGIN